MKLLNYIGVLFLSLSLSTTYAAEQAHPDGEITFRNHSAKTITAAVSEFAQFSLAANTQKNIAYDVLMHVCSNRLTHCTAFFYMDNTLIGSATINVITGKITHQHLAMRVILKSAAHVLRAVTIS